MTPLNNFKYNLKYENHHRELFIFTELCGKIVIISDNTELPKNIELIIMLRNENNNINVKYALNPNKIKEIRELKNQKYNINTESSFLDQTFSKDLDNGSKYMIFEKVKGKIFVVCEYINWDNYDFNDKISKINKILENEIKIKVVKYKNTIKIKKFENIESIYNID